MFKTTYCLLLICTLFMGCNSLQKQTDPVCEKKPAPKPEPEPEMITRIIEPALEFAEEISGNFYDVKVLRVKVLESFPHGAPKKLEVKGEQGYVEILEEAALGKKEATESFCIIKSTPEESSWMLAKDFSFQGLLTSVEVSDYSAKRLNVSVKGTTLGVRKFSNMLRNWVPALVLAKPVVIEKAISLLKEGKKIKRLAQKVGDRYIYVAGSQESIDELNKLAADK